MALFGSVFFTIAHPLPIAICIERYMYIEMSFAKKLLYCSAVVVVVAGVWQWGNYVDVEGESSLPRWNCVCV